MIFPEQLELGDILLLKDFKAGFYRHVAIVSEVNKEQNSYKAIHWRGVGEPYGITEMTLPSKESLAERNCQFECFRLRDSKQALDVLSLLKSWIPWSVPYSETAFKKAETEANKFFSVKSDLFNKINPEINPEKLDLKNQEYLKEMQKLFDDHWADVVKYAARRDLGVVRTKREGKLSGFNCLGGILIALQTSYILDLVKPLKDKWVSNAHINQSNPSSDGMVFEPTEIALQENVTKEIMTQAIPSAFKLDAKLCTVDAFRLAMLADEQTIEYIGKLTTLNQENIKSDKELIENKVSFFKSEGNKQRMKVLEELLEPKYQL